MEVCLPIDIARIQISVFLFFFCLEVRHLAGPYYSILGLEVSISGFSNFRALSIRNDAEGNILNHFEDFSNILRNYFIKTAIIAFLDRFGQTLFSNLPWDVQNQQFIIQMLLFGLKYPHLAQ